MKSSIINFIILPDPCILRHLHRFFVISICNICLIYFFLVEIIGFPDIKFYFIIIFLLIYIIWFVGKYSIVIEGLGVLTFLQTTCFFLVQKCYMPPCFAKKYFQTFIFLLIQEIVVYQGERVLENGLLVINVRLLYSPALVVPENVTAQYTYSLCLHSLQY